MKGRDLIIYILKNNLEDEDVVTNGKFVGFMSVAEAAAKLNTGFNTILALNLIGKLDGEMIGDNLYIPVTSVDKFIGGNNA